MDENVSSLPTIVDVVESLSKMEVDESIRNVGPSVFRMDVDTYNVVTREEGKNIPMLFPNSTSSATFYRGQNKFWNKCVPTLYRNNNASSYDHKLINQIKMAEFFSVVLSHPVVMDFTSNFYLDLTAIAQHYGFSTDYLDITNNKWVAAFFACTQYVNGQYIPVDKDFGDGVGVMYASFPPMLFRLAPPSRDFFNRLNVIGFQYFQRPSKQNSFFYKLGDGENFNDVKWFYKIKFRHDINASKIIFNMSYKQQRFYPDDTTSVIANAILSESYEISWKSVDFAKKHWGINMSDDEIEKVLLRNNIPWHKRNETNIMYDSEQIKNDWDEWNRFGRNDLIRRINPIIPVASL